MLLVQKAVAVLFAAVAIALVGTGSGGHSAAVLQSQQAAQLCDNRMDELKSASGWTLLGPSDGRVNTFEISPDKKIYYIGTNSGGVFRSFDYGQTWENYSNGLTSTISLNVDYLKFVDGVLYATMGNDGNTFKLINDKWIISSKPANMEKPALPIKDNQGTIYYGPYDLFDPLKFSRDNGKTVQQIDNGVPGIYGFWDIRQIYPLDNGKAILANDNGVAEVNTLTKSFRKLGDVPNYSEIRSIAVSQKAGAIATVYWDHQTKISNNCGKEWSGYFGGEGLGFFINPYIGDLLVALGGDRAHLVDLNKDYNLYGPVLEKTENKNNLLGRNNYPYIAVALDVKSTPIRAYAIYSDANDSNSNWLMSFNVVRGSEDGVGAPLDVKYKKLPFANASGVGIDPNNINHIVASESKFIYESFDKGQTWTKIFDRQGYILTQPVINPYDTQEVLVGNSDGSIFRTKNGKSNEVILPKPTGVGVSNSIWSIAFDEKEPNTLYVGTKFGFFFTTDGGNNWKEFSKGLYSRDVRKVIQSSDKVFIGTWGSGNAVILKEKLFNSSVPPTSPVINEFRISQPITNTIRSTTLVWNASNAVSCVLNGPNFANSSYSASEAISTGILTADSSYTLTCKNASGASVSKTLVVTVPPIQPVKPLSPKPNIQVAEPNIYRNLYARGAQNIISWLGGGSGAVKVALVKSDYNPDSDDIIGWIYNGTPNSQTFWQQNTFPSSLIFWNGLSVTAPNGAAVQTQNGFYRILVISKNDAGNYCVTSTTERCSYDLSDVQFTLVGR